ncbi:terminal protein [Rhodococcus opacus]|nr:terminal protein [Rhodococcus opacus]
MAGGAQSSDPKRRSMVFGALTGRPEAAVTPQAGGRPDLKGMLLAAYGLNRRGGLDTATAAKDLGVTQRTVQRWVASAGHQRIAAPKRDTLSALMKKARQAATTQRGRKAALAAVRASKQGKALANHGGHIRIRGHQGPSAAGKTYKRDREIRLELSPSEVEAMWSAYEQGGDKAFSSWITDHADIQYVAGWEFERIDEMHLGR